MTLSTASNVINKVSVQTAVQTQPQSSRQILTSCIIGNALEWYDFVIYGYFVVIFGSLFFPQADHATQVLASWGIFWSGFLARPLGSIVFGHIGDKISRKFALTLSILIMAIPTTLIGCLPTYHQVGILAPVLLVALRALQGFAIGGEFTGSMVFLVEHAPAKKRGFWGSWASFSAVVGVLVGSSVVAMLNMGLSSEAMQTWGWRIPFLLSVIGSVVGIYIRMHLTDPGVYLKVKARRKKESVPIKELMLHHKSKIGAIILLDFLTAVGFFIVAIFLATYFRTYLKYTEHVALSIHTFNMCIFAAATLLGGWMSDRTGRKLMIALPCVGFILFSLPLFQLMQNGEQNSLIFAQGVLSFMLGIFFGTIPSILSEIMPTSVRFSGLSIGHNICMAIVGGGTPFLATHLIQDLHDLTAPAYLLIIASIVSLSSLLLIKNKPEE